MIKKLVLIILSLSILIIVISGISVAADKNDNFPEFLKMAASAPGGNWYPIAAQMCAIIQRELGVLTTVVPGAGLENVKTVHLGDVDTAWTQSSSAYEGFNGLAGYEKDGIKYDSIRHWMTVSPQGAHFVVRANSDIYSINDFKGKRFGFLRVGSGTNDTALRIFEMYGISLDDFKSISYLGYADGPLLLADGNIDVFVTQGTHPYEPLAEINFNPGFRLISIDEEIADEFFSKNPSLMPVIIKDGTYNNMEGDALLAGNYGIVIASNKLSEEFVYDMTKVLYENIELIWESGAAARNYYRLETALLGSGIPVHPGALRYYKEQGIIK